MNDQTTGAGAPAPAKKRGCGFWLLIGAGVLVGLTVIGMLNPQPRDRDERGTEVASESGGAAAPAAEAPVEALAVTATELADAYSANEVSAQARFGDQAVRVTGTIEAVELDFMDEPVVRLGTGEMFRHVSAYFGEAQAAATAGLAKDQQVVLLCGRVRESMGNPQLDNCVIE